MPDASISNVVEHYDATERDILYLLTNGLPIWSVDDLGRDIESLADAEDSVLGLKRAGLVHQISDGFVFATRAGQRMVEIVGKIV